MVLGFALSRIFPPSLLPLFPILLRALLENSGYA